FHSLPRPSCPSSAAPIARSLPPGEDDVSRLLRGNVLCHLIAERAKVDAGEERLAAAEQDGRDRDMHLVDQPRLQILADGGDAAAEADIAAARCLCRAGER